MTYSARAVHNTLRSNDIDYGRLNNIEHNFMALDKNINHSIYFNVGWACCLNQTRNKTISLPTILVIHCLFLGGTADKLRLISADWVCVIVRGEVAENKWFEQALDTEKIIKSFFSMKLTKQQHLIAKLAKERNNTDEIVAAIVAVDVEVAVDVGVVDSGVLLVALALGK